MFYEDNFQNRENPSEFNVSICSYKTESAMGFPKHCHSFYEMEYSIKGARSAYINGCKFKLPENALYFIPPLAIHSTSNEESDTENIIIQFSYEFLHKNSMAMSRKSILTPIGKMLEKHYICPKSKSHLDTILKQLIKLSPARYVDNQDVEYRVDGNLSRNAGKEIAKKQNLEFNVLYSPKLEMKLHSLLLDLLATLMDEEYLTVSENMGDISDAIKLQPILSQLISYPENKLSLEKAAQLACLGCSNFSRMFKRRIGMTYVDYCNILRVREAEELINNTNYSITKISEMLNFGTINYFNRIFKKYNGNSPCQYRNIVCGLKSEKPV